MKDFANLPATVRLAGVVRQVQPGTTIAELLGRQTIRQQRLVAALLNRHLVGLNTSLHYDQEIQPIASGDDVARPVIRQAIQHMFHTVMASLYPNLQLEIGQSLAGGFFYEILPTKGPGPDLDQLAEEATRALTSLRLSDQPFRTVTVSTESALAALAGRPSSRSGLLKAWPHPLVNLVSLNGTIDLQHGPYPLSTGVLPDCRVLAMPPGLVLQLDCERQPKLASHHLLLQSYREARQWNRQMGVATIGQLNEAILEDRLGRIVRLAEALHEKKVVEVAAEICRRQARVICLAGPSSSGKTTVVQRLATQLEVNGLKPMILNLDDYYRARDELPFEEDGMQDFESPQALELSLLNQHLETFLQGQPIRIPRFDFVRGRRLDGEAGRTLQAESNSVLLLEGLHALHPQISGGPLTQSSTFRIFVSALTQLVIDEHNRIQTSKVRLLRRIVRDRRYRGTPVCQTLARWPRVRAGEETHIFPHQASADALFNSSLVYETAVLKSFAQRYLLEVPRDHECQGEAYQLLKFLDLFIPVFPDVVPSTSVLREFIGSPSLQFEKRES